MDVLLLESGGTDNLLLESGDNLLMETGVLPSHGDWLYMDANVGLAVPAQDGDWMWVDVNAGLNIPSQDEDWLYVDGDLVYGAGKVRYPWREADDGSTSPTPRY